MDGDDSDQTLLEALYDCVGVTDEELSFTTGDRFVLLNDSNQEWWHVRCITIKGNPEGYIPSNYCKTVEEVKEEESAIRSPSKPKRILNQRVAKEPVEVSEEEEEEESEEDESEEEEEEELQQVLEQRRLERKRSKRQDATHQKKKLLPPDALRGFGIVPQGFRLSTLAKNYQSGAGRLSQVLIPHLAGHGLAFHDLALDKKKRILPRVAKCTTAFSIIDARSITPPGSDLKVVGRHVRLAIFDRVNILSNIHTVPAIITKDPEPIWKFSSKASLLFPKDDENTCFFRVNEIDIKISLLFELCLVVLHPEQDGKSVQPRTTEVSCGWGLLPLFTADGGPIENKSYEVKLYAGSPFEKESFAPASNPDRKGLLKNLWPEAPKEPRVHIRVWKLGQQVLKNLNTLPEVVITQLSAAPILALYRQNLATSLLSITSKDLKLAPRYDPILALIPIICDQPDIFKFLIAVWERKLKTIPKGEKSKLTLMHRHFLLVVLNVWPLLSVIDMPLYVAGDDETLAARHKVIGNLQNQGPTDFLSKNPTRTMFKPFDTSEVEFDCLPNIQVSVQ